MAAPNDPGPPRVVRPGRRRRRQIHWNRMPGIPWNSWETGCCGKVGGPGWIGRLGQLGQLGRLKGSGAGRRPRSNPSGSPYRTSWSPRSSQESYHSHPSVLAVLMSYWCRERELNPHESFPPRDFKSPASTYSAIPARNNVVKLPRHGPNRNRDCNRRRLQTGALSGSGAMEGD
jgi:hypothetical protein